MDYKKTNGALTTETRNIVDFDQETHNIYESLVIASKRSNQIASELKEELRKKLPMEAEYFQTF